MNFPKLVEGEIDFLITSLSLAMKDPKLSVSLDKLKNKNNSWFGHLMSYTPTDVVVIIAFWKKSKPVGLAMVRNDKEKAAGFFVAPRYRRRGIGGLLLKKAAHLFGKNILCRPWDSGSRNFFLSKSISKVGVRITGVKSVVDNA